MSVIGAQITSSGEIPLLRSVIKHHIPFAPNSDLSLEPSNVRRTQPELQPWTPVMSNMQDITGVSTTNFAGPSFKIPDQPIGRIALDPLVTGRLGPIGLLTMRPNSLQKGFMAIYDTEFVPNSDPRVPPAQRGDGTKLVEIRVQNTFSATPPTPNPWGSLVVTDTVPNVPTTIPGPPFVDLQTTQRIPEAVKPAAGYQHGSASGTRNKNPSSWHLNNEVYVGNAKNAFNLFTFNASGQRGLPKAGVKVAAAPFNADTTGNGSYSAITFANGGRTGHFSVVALGVPTETVNGSGSGLTLAITTSANGKVLSATVQTQGQGYNPGDLVLVDEPNFLPAADAMPAAFFVGTVEIKTFSPPKNSNFRGMGIIGGVHGRGGGTHQLYDLYPRISNMKGILSAREMQPSLLAGASLPIGRLPGSGTVVSGAGGLPSNAWGDPGNVPAGTAPGTIRDADRLLYAFGFPSGQKTLLPNYLLLAGQNTSNAFSSGSYIPGTDSSEALKQQLIGHGLNSGQGYMSANNGETSSIDHIKPVSDAPNATGAVGVGFIKPKNSIGAGVDSNNPVAIPTVAAFNGISRQQVLNSKLSDGSTFLGQTLEGRANDRFEEVDYQVAYTATYPTSMRTRDPIRGPGITINGRTQIASIPPGGAPPPEDPTAPSF